MLERMDICEHNIYLYCLIVLDLFGLSVSSLGRHQVFDKVLKDLEYDRRERPGALTGEQTVVHVTMNVNDISSVDELDMEFSIDIYLRQSWHDHRLATNLFNDTLLLNQECISKIWVPDLYISNSKHGLFHDITVPNVLLRISPNGTILYSQRLTLLVACSLSLEKYPLDNQTCRVKMESYSHTEDELLFLWPGPGEYAIQRDDDISLPEFVIEQLDSGYCTIAYTTGTFTCIYAEVKFKRTIGYYLIQTYIPSILVVILSWVSFWIDLHAVPARITLGLLTVLTMTTQASAITQTLPRVSYIKAIDVWIAMCLLFVAGSLLEYSVVNVLARRVQGKLLRKMTRHTPLHGQSTGSLSRLNLRSSISWLTSGELSNKVMRAMTSNSSLNSNGTTAQTDLTNVENGAAENNEDIEVDKDDSPSCSCACLSNIWQKDKALYVDKISRVVFPGTFVVFNIMYWVYYVYIVT